MAFTASLNVLNSAAERLASKETDRQADWADLKPLLKSLPWEDYYKNAFNDVSAALQQYSTDYDIAVAFLYAGPDLVAKRKWNWKVLAEFIVWVFNNARDAIGDDLSHHSFFVPITRDHTEVMACALGKVRKKLSPDQLKHIAETELQVGGWSRRELATFFTACRGWLTPEEILKDNVSFCSELPWQLLQGQLVNEPTAVPKETLPSYIAEFLHYVVGPNPSHDDWRFGLAVASSLCDSEDEDESERNETVFSQALRRFYSTLSDKVAIQFWESMVDREILP